MAEALGTELNFLTYRLSIKGKYIEALLSSERFYRHFLEIKKNGIQIDDKLVYQELEKMIFPIMYEESCYQYDEDYKQKYVELHGEAAYKTMRTDYYAFRRALSKLSKVLYNDSDYWQSDYEEECGRPYIAPVIKSRVKIPEENEDLSYILDVCSELKVGSLEKLLTEKLTVNAFRKAGKVTDIRHAYKIFNNVFYECMNLGYNNSSDREKKKTFFRLRSVAEDFSNTFYGDKNHWRKDKI